MDRRKRNIVWSLSVFRLLLAPLLVVLAALECWSAVSILLMTGFLTDVSDGFLARRWKVASELGAHIDGLADDLFIFCASLAVYIANPLFVRIHIIVIAAVFFLIVLQNAIVLIRFGHRSSFHTILAKLSFFLQAVYLIHFFVVGEHNLWFFYATMFVTIAGLCEEIIISFVLPQLKTDVKGLYWLLKKKPV